MSAESLWRSAVAVLEAWTSGDAGDEALRHTMLAFLAASPEACLRANVAGHITASALVLNESRDQVLLTLHPRVGRWIQLGGHCEPGDDTVVAAALREATEESGIERMRIDPELLGAHTHPITCSLGVPTRHLDLRFLVLAADGAEPVRSHESDDLRWFPVDALPDNTEPDLIGALIRTARARTHCVGM